MEELPRKTGRPKARQSIAHIPGKDNTTTDIAAIQRAQNAQAKTKRSRGKSLGPGGLEALKESEGNTAKVAPVFIPKSILKPTVPLTPPKNIPSFDELRKRGTSKAKSPAKSNADELLIDFSTPGPARDTTSSLVATNNTIIPDPFSPIAQGNPNDLATTVDSSNGGLDEEDERRKAQKEAILEERKKRADKRKSMGLRRVSFAPEATLHTWSVMELVEDSTTSSASNSTRRQSSMTAAQSPAAKAASPEKSSDAVEPPSTPPAQLEDPLVHSSPEHQRDLHQKKRRRSSENLEDSDGDAFSSPGDGGDSSPIRVEESIDSESDTDGDTAMSLDEATANTMASSDTVDSQSSLDNRLRAAATQAGTRGIEYDEKFSDDDNDETEDQSMEIAEGTVTHAFRQYARKGHNIPQHQDKENMNPFEERAARASLAQEELDGNTTADMTMEMTKAVGGILPGREASTKLHPNRRRSNMVNRVSLSAESEADDESMDLTVAKGGILDNDQEDEDADDDDDDDADDATMEFTTVVGGLKNRTRRASAEDSAAEETEAMDVTMAAGTILEPIEEQTEPQTDVDEGFTAAMDMTKAVGQILSKQQQERGNAQESHSLPGEDDQPSPSAQLNVELNTATQEHSPKQSSVALDVSETGSPSLKPRLSGRRAVPTSRSNTPRATPTRPSSRKASPSKAASVRASSTPTKQATPLPAKSASPMRSTPVTDKNVSLRVSPKKLFQAEIREKASPAQQKVSKKERDLLFSTDSTTGLHTPKVVLHAPKPHQHLRRRSSGIGADKEGSGSPRVSELLSRRSSIGDAAAEFKLGPQKSHISFADPKQMEQEVDHERAEEHRRESGRFIMEQEAGERQEENTTLQLRDMINSMSPVKNKTAKFRGRKSLAVGSARGLLGKRPAELDSDEDEQESGTPKRLRAVSREGSPVKKVQLPRPPTKEETTGRLTGAEQALLSTFSTQSPSSNQSLAEKALSPVRVGRFRDQDVTPKATSFETKLDNVINAIDVATTHPELIQGNVDEEKIPLQQFLNMTNIHFIELSTTKRRHTTAQSMLPKTKDQSPGDTLQASFVAATTTLPLLELYQHATRELKSYISTGRKIIRSIEAETLAEQPPLFREYVEARPEVKAIMDNQFRNGKTNARLQSKEGWYSWRGQLVDGLRSGLDGIKAGLRKDKEVLDKHVTEVDSVLPDLVSRKELLRKEWQRLKARLSHLDSFDREALKSKCKQLQSLDERVAEQNKLAETLKQQMSDKEDALSQAAELRTEMQEQITEAVRVREEQRGWPTKDVLALKKRVEQIEREHGWKLLTAEENSEEPNNFGTATTLLYQNQLRLFFHPSTFQPGLDASRRRSGRPSRSVSGPSAPISLAYSPDSTEGDTSMEMTTEKRFFLQLIRSQLQAYSMMPQGSVSCQTVLKTVSEGWALAEQVSEELRLLNMLGVVRVSIAGDERLSVKLAILQKERSRIDINFSLTVLPSSDGDMSSATSITSEVVYGSVSRIIDGPKIRKVQSALTKEVESKPLGKGNWANAVHDFEDWLKTQMDLPQALPAEAVQRPPATKKAKTPAVPKKTKPQPVTDLAAEDHAPTQEEMLPTTKPLVQHTPPAHSFRSSVQSTTPPVAPTRRSPLAPKTTNSKVTKKSIPVPSSKMSAKAAAILAHEAAFAEAERKENIPTVVGMEVSKKSMEADDVFGGRATSEDNQIPGEVDWGNAAIPPEMQEQMMRTPVKRRVGALRRSPI